MGLVANTGRIPFCITPPLSSLLDSCNSLIYGRAFYTLDDSSSGNRIIYFSHWIPTPHDRMLLTPCPGCSLHCLEDNEGPLALKSVGGKINSSILFINPSFL
ncbi:unnamed protein product [Rhizophagus irregularis]|nr:unnamed protein product [Rhizophagus irregularis]